MTRAPTPEKIAVIKVGWCETYDGDMPVGAHANISRNNEGHERYNFLPGPDGRFYGYAPPIGKDEAAPSPTIKDGWLVFVVAKAPKRGGIRLVGWYDGAAFCGRYQKRPEYETTPPELERDALDGAYSFTLTAQSATLIPGPERHLSFKGDRTKRSPVYYLKGNGKREAWRDDLARLLLSEKQRIESAALTVRSAKTRTDLGGICGDQERRKEVEEAAIAQVRAHYGAAYHFRDRQKDNCGYDLLFTHKKSGSEVHVEVKGTAMDAAHFFITPNECNKAEEDEHWMLAIVTRALDKPQLQILSYAEALKMFDWAVVCWHATLRKI